ncbi:LacI family DNA-binding transcriptional regulator [Actinomadura meridiana]|uniref:LacI family DNA-binding transcriptional regulator n=1 Tax=Actinomadura meridiana TaxID=559626 RepID=UPI0031E99E61
MAERAHVSVGTVSNVLHHPGRVADSTRERVQAAMLCLGCTPSTATPATASVSPHWRRSGSRHGCSVLRCQGGTRRRHRSPPGPCRC